MNIHISICICMYICSLTLGACPAANRTYATYGGPVTADVSVLVCARMRESEQYLTNQIAAALRDLHVYLSACLFVCLPACQSVCLSICRSLSFCLPVCLSACLPVCLPVCLPACLSACLSVSRSLSFCLSCPILLGSFPKETCHFSTPPNSSHKSCNTHHNTHCNTLRHSALEEP